MEETMLGSSRLLKSIGADLLGVGFLIALFTSSKPSSLKDLGSSSQPKRSVSSNSEAERELLASSVVSS
jgi:hypothetical protein